MATGGFKAFEYNLAAHTAPTTASVVEGYVKELLKGITQGIISTNSNWGYDPSFTATADDYIKIGTSTDYKAQAYAQFLINSVSGCKLLVYYNVGTYLGVGYTSLLISADSQNTPGEARYKVGGGLCFSMIPGGVNETWNVSNSCTEETFLPAHATRIVSTSACHYVSGGYYDYSNTYSSVLSGGSMRYVLCVKDDLIIVMNQVVNSGNINRLFAVGKIFGQLNNATDNTAYAQYGAWCFSDNAFNHKESTSATYGNSRSGGKYFVTSTNYSTYVFSGIDMIQVFHNNQNLASSVLMGGYVWTSNPNVYGGGFNVSSASNKSAFAPMQYARAISDETDGIVPGNGYKGYFDTDAFRCVYYGFPYNTLFDDGKFIYVGSGLAVGWDASNDVILRT